MILHVNKTSTYALQILENHTTAAVHSVYNSVINVTVNGRLLALQTANSPLSPISLITDLDVTEMASLSVKTGEEITLDYTDATVLDLNPKHRTSRAVRQDLFKKFSKIVQRSETNGFDLIFQFSPKVGQDFILTAAETKIHLANTCFRKRDYREATRIISELVGVGIGLTPSGDDFLCGILAGFHIHGKQNSRKVQFLRDSISQNLSRTNEISRAFLQCAIDGHFSQAVNELWNNPDIDTIEQMFHNIGHSSGMDTLCGIYFLFFLME